MWMYQNKTYGNESVTNISISYNEKDGWLYYCKETICSWTGNDEESGHIEVEHNQELVDKVCEIDKEALESLFEKFPELKEIEDDGETVTISKKRYEQLLEIEWMYNDLL